MNFTQIKKKKFTYLLIFAAIIAISWDIATSTLAVEEGTYRLESEFDGYSGATSFVGIVTSDYDQLSDPVSRTTNPSYQQIEEMVAKAIELQEGFDGVIEKGNKVMIKVNLVGANSPSGDGENTDVRVVKALIKLIADFTDKDVEIIVAEGSARTNDDPESSSSVWGNSGYRSLLSDADLTGINLRLLNLNQNYEDLVEIDLAENATYSIQNSTSWHIHKEEAEADVYITVPVLKIHDTGITNALKLQIGSAPGCFYGYNKTKGTSHWPGGIIHDDGQRRWTTEAIVDLSNVADIDFVVVDAIMCLEREKVKRSDNQVRFNTVIAGKDPVAVDHVCAKLMGINPDDVAHITLAEKVGLGHNSRDKIWVAGVPIKDAMKKVVKSTAVEGVFGQSNRTWILSEAFSGTDIDQKFYVDEPTIQPIPGEDGWSEPVYFFDDRIDLYSYYQGATNVITYAFTYFDTPEDVEAELWLINHEAIAVYLNGEEAYKYTSTYSISDEDRGKYKAKIDVKKGRNTLLVKTLNKFGDFTFSLNICEVDNSKYKGNRVDSLMFYLDGSGTGTEYRTGISTIKNSNSHALECYPNPVTDFATINFMLKESTKTNVSIYNLNGKLVEVLCNKNLKAGNNTINWNINNQGIRKGSYLCVVQAGGEKSSTKISVK